MAQITLHGPLRPSSANAFLNGPADKANNVSPLTLFYNSSNPIAVNDMLYTDAGYTNVYQGGGGQEFLYASSDSMMLWQQTLLLKYAGFLGADLLLVRLNL